MKKILIVICDMRIGGAQKSLLSFLQALSEKNPDEEYELHLLPLNPSGEYLEHIPDGIHLRLPDDTLRWLGSRVNRDLLLKHFSLRGLLGEVCWLCRKWFGFRGEAGNIQQRVWRAWKSILPACGDSFDVAIAYIDGIPSYYVMDKVKAGKKVLWLHSDYEKQAYDSAFDRAYYKACDMIITVSEECRAAFCRALPEQAEKIKILENISSSASILALSRQGECPEYGEGTGWRILTVGRLHWQKGMDIAIEAACFLRQHGIDFTWLIVGEGSERANLEELIRRKGLTDCVKLIGSRDNPYKYMRDCDILVQASRVEGRSIVLDEAKILNVPIVATNYPTVRDALTDEETGLIVEMNPEAVGNGVMRLMNDDGLRNALIRNLRLLPKGNEQELERYIGMMF